MSLLGLFESARLARWRDAVVFEYLAKQRWVSPIRGLRTDHHKLTHYLHTGERELYDLRVDPHERHSLVGHSAHAATLAALQWRLDDCRRAVGDAGRWETGAGV